MTKCPYCGRNLREHERYCDFCEQDISKAVDEAEKPDVKPSDFKEEVKKDIERVKSFSETLVKIAKNIKKKLKREK